jgi:predicted CXXCH cytochrome family protein
MKSLMFKSVAAMLLLFAAVVSGQSIVGSAHDFSSSAWNTSGEICIVCHTPHNADVSVTNAPLDATVGQPDASSKLCLSCHDGTVAVDNFGGTTSGTTTLTGSTLIGTNLLDDHPVSFTYNSSLANNDGGLHDPSTTNSGLGGTIDQDMLIGGQVQCASCHDVHNGSGLSMLLRKSNAGSGLCLTCHNK